VEDIVHENPISYLTIVPASNVSSIPSMRGCFLFVALFSAYLGMFHKTGGCTYHIFVHRPKCIHIAFY